MVLRALLAHFAHRFRHAPARVVTSRVLGLTCSASPRAAAALAPRHPSEQISIASKIAAEVSGVTVERRHELEVYEIESRPNVAADEFM